MFKQAAVYKHAIIFVCDFILGIRVICNTIVKRHITLKTAC